ncbi:FG-GAP repeat domain-containing protein [Cyclobacterium plantarum]|uniref:FG-GAP repeat domain-containing protein n=1 Tax=Cyclobacterium plantarum TaxID=2716263 RepID=UPI003F70E846
MLHYPFINLLLLAIAFLGEKEAINGDSFKHHFISNELPGDENWGYGISILEDLDNDGDLDFVTAVKSDSIYWFDNRGSEEWVRHAVGKINTVQLGSAVTDVDGDGWPDIIIGGDWYQNPKNPKDAPFKRFKYDRRIENEIHDIVLADIDGDGQDEIVVSGDKEGCFWYKIPPHPVQDIDWERHTITMDVLKGNEAIHSGIWPAGIDDLDNDGDVDLVLPDRWLENKNRGKDWEKHGLPFGKRGPWGLSSRSWIIDMDKDGDKDIVIADSDQTACRIAWLENDGLDSPTFKAHYLPVTAPGTNGSFHSLALADFDGDGDMDIFTVEQEDPTIFPEGRGPRWYIWENMDGKGGEFEERVIFDGNLGGTMH